MKPLFSSLSALGVSWVQGEPVLCRSAAGRTWRSDGPIRTADELAGALRSGVDALGRPRGEAHLLLGHAQLAHRVETVPALRAAALHRYLGHLLSRESPPVRWSAIPLLPARGEQRVLLHLIPAELAARIESAFAASGLRLTRLFPLTAALDLPATAETAAADKESGFTLSAAPHGGQTVLLVKRADGAIAFARSFAADWSREPERLGLEVNRSIIYLRQRWGAAPSRITLLDGAAVAAAVSARCGGAGGEIACPPRDESSWLAGLASVPPSDRGNVLGGEWRRRRARFLARTAAIAACWAGLALLLLGWWSEAQAIQGVREQTAALRARRGAELAERDRLLRRNRRMEADRALVARIKDAALPPVPVRFLVYQASLLPPALQLSSYSAAWDGTRWAVAMDGRLRADDPAARLGLQDWQERLQNGPWHARFAAGQGTAPETATRFRLEGGLLEN